MKCHLKLLSFLRRFISVWILVYLVNATTASYGVTFDYIVAEADVDIRSVPSQESPSIGVIKKGEKVYFEKIISDKWGQLSPSAFVDLTGLYPLNKSSNSYDTILAILLSERFDLLVIAFIFVVILVIPRWSIPFRNVSPASILRAVKNESMVRSVEISIDSLASVDGHEIHVNSSGLQLRNSEVSIVNRFILIFAKQDPSAKDVLANCVKYVNTAEHKGIIANLLAEIRANGINASSAFSPDQLKKISKWKPIGSTETLKKNPVVLKLLAEIESAVWPVTMGTENIQNRLSLIADETINRFLAGNDGLLLKQFLLKMLPPSRVALHLANLEDDELQIRLQKYSDQDFDQPPISYQQAVVFINELQFKSDWKYFSKQSQLQPDVIDDFSESLRKTQLDHRRRNRSLAKASANSSNYFDKRKKSSRVLKKTIPPISPQPRQQVATKGEIRKNYFLQKNKDC